MLTPISIGSVKDIYECSDRKDELVFRFSDRYSIFDWGEMPNVLLRKGEALAKMGATFFKLLEKKGIKNHFISFDGKRDLRVQKVFVPRNQPITFYQTRPTKTLVPLECLFRLGLAEGSSLLSRLGDSETKWRDAGFSRVYRPGELWDEEIFVEFSTKLEKQDRLLSDIEAQNLAGCTIEEWTDLKKQVRTIAQELKQIFEARGIVLWDGKVEFAFGEKMSLDSETRELILVDSIGLDELRLTFEGHSLSKEILRQMYKKTPWYEALQLSKRNAGNQFKEYCIHELKQTPSILPEKIGEVVTSLYEAVADLITNDVSESKNIHHRLRNNLRLIDACKNPSKYENILIMGGGGREHGIALRLLQDKKTINVFVSPGNPGMEYVEGIFALGGEEIKNWATYFPMDFAIIGPEQYIYSEFKNEIEALGIPVIAPNKEGAQLEESKIFSKKFMETQQIPTAGFLEFSSVTHATQNMDQLPKGWPGYVVKLSGPALGKGVFVVDTLGEVSSILSELQTNPMEGQEQGLVIEEKLTGRECSLFYACLDGEYKYLGEACDHKRLLDGDLGPNTGGMGAISPVPWLSESDRIDIEAKFLRPTLRGLKSRNCSYSGFLFLGLLQDQKKGFQLLEYNVRLGDPETQTFLFLLEGPLTTFLKSLATKNLEEFLKLKNEINRNENKYACHVVKVAKGYPGIFGETVEKDKLINGVDYETNDNQQWWIYGGVKKSKDDHNQLVTSGGRVLGITTVKDSFTQARKMAYEAIVKKDFEGSFYRKDIGMGAAHE